MKRFLTPRVLTLIALALVAFGIAAAGCARKISSVDASYTTLVGRPNANTRLVVWQDTPNNVIHFYDAPPPGPPVVIGNPTDDTILSVSQVYRDGPGIVQTLLFDGSQADGFQFFRRAASGGLEQLRDFTVNPSRKWLDTQWEMYPLTDQTPSSFSPPTYIARGLLGGQITSLSPLSNSAEISQPVPTRTIKFVGTNLPSDSLFTIGWTPVANAAGYWLHVYQFRAEASSQEMVASGTPSPIWSGAVDDQFVGYLPAPATSYKLGDPGPLVLSFRRPLFGQTYLVRISAVDATGQLVAFTAGDSGLIQSNGFYDKFLLAAKAINPTRPHAGATSARPAQDTAILKHAFGIPNFSILPAR